MIKEKVRRGEEKGVERRVDEGDGEGVGEREER